MISEKYAKYYKSQPVRDFTGLYPQLTAPSFHIHGREWDSGYRMDWFCVTEPFLMINDPHTMISTSSWLSRTPTRPG